VVRLGKGVVRGTFIKTSANSDASEQHALAGLSISALTLVDRDFREVVDALPAAVYTTDAAGRIMYFNEAAAALWGRRPELGVSEWCGSWKLFWPDGRPLPHDQCPMAIALKERRAIRGTETIAERPDGTRVPFVPFPALLRDASGAVIGAVNMLVDITDRKQTEELIQRLAAIVESADDAILTKNLNGIITSWNKGAQRLFGYTAEEIVGRSVTTLIPVERQDEEPTILARVRRGERIDHYETIRKRKDGSLVEISLTVSPVKNAHGEVVGASKIARDITERRRAQEQQNLLLREMNHRIMNLFALSSSVVTLSARSAETPEELASVVCERLRALARAHALTLTKPSDGVGQIEQSTTLHTLIQTIMSPYVGRMNEKTARVVVNGPDIPLSGSLVTSFALLLHEFATNAAKYGALLTSTGHIDIDCSEENDQFLLRWTESSGPPVEHRADSEGFGTLLARMTVRGQLGGEISHEWNPEGLRIRLSVARDRLSGPK
jgi:PAS domain S-box-containing protein